jgi:hypothetical protein
MENELLNPNGAVGVKFGSSAPELFPWAMLLPLAWHPTYFVLAESSQWPKLRRWELRLQTEFSYLADFMYWQNQSHFTFSFKITLYAAEDKAFVLHVDRAFTCSR